MTHRFRMTVLLFLASFVLGCSGDDTAVDKKDRASPLRAAAEPAPKSRYEAGPAFCGKIRPVVVEAIFEFKLQLAGVSVANELECHYNLNVPGSLLIYRMQPMVMYNALKGSRRKTGDIPNLGEEAIFIGKAQLQIDVKLDDVRAFEVALQLINTSGEPLPITPEKAREGLIRLARQLSVRL